MQILLADAKIMFAEAAIPPSSIPVFQTDADTAAQELLQFDTETIAKAFACSQTIAKQVQDYYKNYPTAKPLPAILAYNGQAYKHLQAHTLSTTDLHFAQQHLYITSFLYGLLRPLDAIVPYRMELTVRQKLNTPPLLNDWKTCLTNHILQSCNSDDNTLIHLATEEYQHLFHWQQLQSSLKLIQPFFYVRHPKKGLTIQAVHAKSCRGAMTCFILQNRLQNPQHLSEFTYQGFTYQPDESTPNRLIFIKE